MRFLHIADLHLGKRLNNASFTEDQKYILERIAEIAEKEKADALLIAGDIYQSADPTAEAMALFDAFLTRITHSGMQVFAISGNHDSSLRIGYMRDLLVRSGVHMVGEFDGRLHCDTVRDPYGELDIYYLPFVRPASVRRFFPGQRLENCSDVVKAALATAEPGRERRSVLLCHQFITGASTSDSEERIVGGVDNVDASVFDAFDYVALGHIHGPQKVSRDTLRYAGSPLKYSFSEAEQRKSVVIVDMAEKGNVQIRKIPLEPLHDLCVVTGKIDELMGSAPYSEDYVWVKVQDELPPPDARETLRTRFPNMMRYSVQNDKTGNENEAEWVDTAIRTPKQLFQDFYRLMNNNEEPTGDHMKILDDILDALGVDRR